MAFGAAFRTRGWASVDSRPLLVTLVHVALPRRERAFVTRSDF